MSVLIAGCGDLGTEAGLRYAAAGHHVTGWRRSPDKLPSVINGVAADLRVAAPTVPADTTILVIALAADGHDEDAYRSAYVDGTARVLDALDRDGVTPGHALFVSSTAVYGSLSGDVDETSPTEPTAFNGRVMLEAEQLFLSRLAGSGTTATVLRLGGIYGPSRTRLLDLVRTGTATIPTPDRRTARIHRDDAAAAIVHLTTTDAQGIFLGVDDSPAPYGEVVRRLAGAMDAPTPQQAEKPSARGADRACSNARLRATGWAPAFPTYAEGYRAILAGVGARHP
ncbi:NAD-dependent epimerase/dehydratase family protein [Nocardioides jejuensis]|uniref:NAD-dependent epimerase/dehydratase family protein n=1 Tax=Nocardioides jejuensis TaxID=2502782 RepID=A0A4R1CEZ6_9ACTN|nr:NAD-dependent epimerase/dehydratase family protein [Nocardioides jejuensis]TCJ29854.1 NAD-dependent epimerase/dehydratase family protein [Nocardioides jejuensis]